MTYTLVLIVALCKAQTLCTTDYKYLGTYKEPALYKVQYLPNGNKHSVLVEAIPLLCTQAAKDMGIVSGTYKCIPSGD